MKQAFVRWAFRSFFLVLFRVFTRLTVIGRENIPPLDSGPLIIVANHFSLFEVPLVGYMLPEMPTFLGAAELQESRLISTMTAAHPGKVISVKRGLGDRHAIREAGALLRRGGWLSIFPEGGITAETIATASQGLSTQGMDNHNSRLDAQLLPAQSGAAYLAVGSQARILPIAFLGTEKIEANVRNLRFRRVPVEMRIGKPFGPLELPPEVKGKERRGLITNYSHLMMEQVAQLMPPENRGYYAPALKDKN